MQAYREAFRPSALCTEPRGSIGVFVLCADTEAEAERLASSRDLWRLRLDRGIIGPVPTVEEALAYPYSEAERARVAFNRRRQIVGTPEQCRARLRELGGLFGIDEFVVVSICHDFAARKRSYQLLAEAFALAPAGEVGAAG
jgi:alkanesulfonate monooxygenase SsuD/methylene tetrahydromethanopterin reductase-like flavin-dependent oxidoreductase (luciferase family)